ncbi:MAG: hypothetical protein QXP20_06300 [Candidatus Bathyarchaeia archaeon]
MGFLRDLLNVLRKMKRSSSFQFACPRCNSQKIHISSKFDVWLTPEQYVCENCGYMGPIVLQLEKDKQLRNLA